MGIPLLSAESDIVPAAAEGMLGMFKAFRGFLLARRTLRLRHTSANQKKAQSTMACMWTVERGLWTACSPAACLETCKSSSSQLQQTQEAHSTVSPYAR